MFKADHDDSIYNTNGCVSDLRGSTVSGKRFVKVLVKHVGVAFFLHRAHTDLPKATLPLSPSPLAWPQDQHGGDRRNKS